MKSITLVLSPEQLAVINRALLAAPYGEVAPLINEINAQIQIAMDKAVDKREENIPLPRLFDPE